MTETEAEGEVTDVESVMTEKSNTESELSSNYGKLKHSDSLLLLTQVGNHPFVSFVEGNRYHDSKIPIQRFELSSLEKVFLFYSLHC